ISLWLLTFCAPASASSSQASPPDDGRVAVGQAFLDVMREAARSGALAIEAPALVERLRRMLPRVRFWLQEPVGSFASAPFTFVRPSATAIASPGSPLPSRSDDEWRDTLQSLVITANKPPSGASQRDA